MGNVIDAEMELVAVCRLYMPINMSVPWSFGRQRLGRECFESKDLKTSEP